MLKLFLWLKNLRKRKIVLLSITAVALACALLIVVASIFSGFIKAVESSAGEVLGDIVIRPTVKLARYDELIADLQQMPEISAATAALQSNGLLLLGQGNVRAVSVWGIDAAGRAAVMNFKSALVRQKDSAGEPGFAIPGDPNTPGMFVGIGVLGDPNERTDEYDFAGAKAMTGQSLVLTTGSMRGESDDSAGGATNFRARAIQFKMADAVFTGVYELDSKFVYVPLDVLQEKLYPGLTPTVDMVQIKLKDPAQANAAVEKIRHIFETFAAEKLNWGTYLIGETAIETAKQVQQQYIAALQKQMALLLIIFGAASLGAILLIFCIFYIIVITKQKDIAVLKACGTSDTSIAMLFLSYGIFIGIAGSILGAIIGYYFVRNINMIEHWVTVIFGLKIWKSSVYLFSKIPNEMDTHAAVWIMLAAIAAAAIGALIPAIAAARMKPVRILRYE